MRVVVEIESGSRVGGRWLLKPGDRMTFGRSERADIIIADDQILSSCHFQVSVDVDTCTVKDMGSTNGTWVGDQRISTLQVEDGERIKAGTSTFIFKVDARDAYKRTNEDANAKIREKITYRESSQRTTTRTVAANEVAHESLKRTDPAQPVPRDLAVGMSQCISGVWCGVQTAPVAVPLDMLELLTRSIKPMFVIDFGRTGLQPAEPADGKSLGFLMGNLPTETAAIVSPRMLQSTNFAERTEWVSNGWGKDGVTIILSHVDLDPMLEHFQRMMRTKTTISENNRGMLGLCWPSVLEAVLRVGSPKLVAELIEPCEAILIDSPDSPGGWALYGDNRLRQMLVTCQIPQAYVAECDTHPG